MTILFAAVLTLAPPKAADPTPVIPTETRVYVPVVIRVDGLTPAAQGRVKITPAPAWREDVGVGLTRFTGPPGKYHVDLLLIDFDAKKYVEAEGDTTIIGDAPAPPIVPPTPTDPLQLAINAAYTTDAPIDGGMRKLAAAKYVAYYRAAGDVCWGSSATNTDQLWTQVQAVENAAGIDLTALPGVRALLKAEMVKLFPNATSTTDAVDDTKRKATASLYRRFASLLEGAAK